MQKDTAPSVETNSGLNWAPWHRGRKHTCISHSSPVFDSQHFKAFFLLMLLSFIDGTAQNSRQRLDNVIQTHQVLVSGKPLLQKGPQRIVTNLLFHSGVALGVLDACAFGGECLGTEVATEQLDALKMFDKVWNQERLQHRSYT